MDDEPGVLEKKRSIEITERVATISVNDKSLSKVVSSAILCRRVPSGRPPHMSERKALVTVDGWPQVLGPSSAALFL